MRSLAELVDFSLEVVRSSRDLLEDTIPYPRCASGPWSAGGQGSLSGRMGIAKSMPDTSGDGTQAGDRPR